MSVHDAGLAGVFGELTRFRQAFYECLSRRTDALFELVDAVLCADGPVRSLPELSLVGQHRRGHGSLYAGLARGRVDAGQLRGALAAGPLPRAADGRLVLAVDITCWLRPEAHTSPRRVLCHTYGRGKDTHIMVPGWPYSVIVALETGRSSWTAPLDAVRLAPGDDAATVTARQVRQVVTHLIEANHWQPGDPEIMLVADAGYDGPRLAFLLTDLPVVVLVRMRSDRVLRRCTPVHLPGTVGRPRRHGDEFVFGDPATWGEPDVTTRTNTRLYGSALARAWDRLHPRLTHRTAWTTHLESSPSSRAPSSASRLTGCRPEQSRNRSGSGTPEQVSTPPWSTCAGRRSCAGSTSSTPSACSNKPSAGPPRNSAHPNRQTAGPGSSSPLTPNSASPAASPPTCVAPGRRPLDQAE